MLETKGKSENFKGSAPSVSPTALPMGLFSSVEGGVPKQGSFARLPGKTLRTTGRAVGGVISIYQFSQKIAVQRFSGLEIFDLGELIPNPVDYVYDNESNLVYDNLGIPVTQ